MELDNPAPTAHVGAEMQKDSFVAITPRARYLSLGKLELDK
jgi:hypothetical protein